jgi:hypothetical protein
MIMTTSTIAQSGGQGLVVTGAAAVLADPRLGSSLPQRREDPEAGEVVGPLDDGHGERQHRVAQPTSRSA